MFTIEGWLLIGLVTLVLGAAYDYLRGEMLKVKVGDLSIIILIVALGPIGFIFLLWHALNQYKDKVLFSFKSKKKKIDDIFPDLDEDEH